MDPLAFITGSRIYGHPTKDSDIDLVIYTDQETKELLIALSDTGKQPCKFGKLNLILTTDKDEYNSWLVAKFSCMVLSPITKERAVEIHNIAREILGVYYNDESGN